jgi:hypothetical protein
VNRALRAGRCSRCLADSISRRVERTRQAAPKTRRARYLAGEIPLRLQSTSNFTQWATLPNSPEVGANGAIFTLPPPTNHPSFFRAVITPP